MSNHLFRALNFMAAGRYLKPGVKTKIQQPETWSKICFDQHGLILKQRLSKRIVKQIRFGGVLLENPQNSSMACLFSECFNSEMFLNIKDKFRGDMLNVGFTRGIELDSKEDLFTITKVVSEDSEKFTLEPCTDSKFQMLTFIRKADWRFVFQNHLRMRRTTWKRYFINPWSISMDQQDMVSYNPSAKLNWILEDQPYELGHEQPIEIENIKVLPVDEVSEIDKDGLLSDFRVVSSVCQINNAVLALLLDACRKRLFLDSTRLGKK